MTPEGVMIFAAGFGRRLMPLTENCPKPMIDVCGRPMIDYALGHAVGVGADPIIVNTHYQADVLEDYLANTGATTLRETPDILDTGGGLLNALDYFGTIPVWTLNPDAYWVGENPLAFVLRHWSPESMDALLLCLEPQSAFASQSTGDFSTDADGRLSRGGGLIYGGVQIFKTHGLKDITKPAFSLNEVWNDYQSQGKLFGCVYPGHWFDLGNLAGLELAEKRMATANV